MLHAPDPGLAGGHEGAVPGRKLFADGADVWPGAGAGEGGDVGGGGPELLQGGGGDEGREEDVALLVEGLEGGGHLFFFFFSVVMFRRLVCLFWFGLKG